MPNLKCPLPLLPVIGYAWPSGKVARPPVPSIEIAQGSSNHCRCLMFLSHRTSHSLVAVIILLRLVLYVFLDDLPDESKRLSQTPDGSEGHMLMAFQGFKFQDPGAPLVSLFRH